MKSMVIVKCATVFAFALMLGSLTLSAFAADPPAASKAAKKALRLPPLYGDVIDEEQRDKIVAIYSDYNERLANMRRQIKELAAERDRALESQLSDKQQAKLNKLRAEAKAKDNKMADDE